MDESDEEASKELQDELLLLQVQLLFKRINDGTVTIAEHLTASLEALQQVKFDKRGLPLLHTVPQRVRSLARTHGLIALDRKDRADDELAANSPIHQMLPELTAVTEEVLAKCASENRFLPLAYNLYAEAMYLIALCATLSDYSTQSMERNQAICAGSLMRIVKFMRATLVLADDDQHSEVLYALTRPIAESAVTVRFLATKDDEKLYTRFVEHSLGPERELYDIIQGNVAARNGNILPIEQQMLDSIDHYCQLSGLKIEGVSPKDPDWGGNVRQRLDAIGEPNAYASFFRGPSHAVHGSWVDLIMRHLRIENGQFSVRLESPGADVRMLLPVALFVIPAAVDYLERFFGDHPQLRPLLERVDDLTQRILDVDNAHREWRDTAWRQRQPDGSDEGTIVG